ncbi:MAG: hypothetical protein M1817_005670 [Caeruleum heppii]|nr:MAG: hypothetical protein M1817_005670 [Caeruleum heppii]
MTASTLRERDLSSRLSYFLPALAAANKVLDEDRVAGTLEQKRLETVTKDEPYIEMNLGLGVLEEKQGESSDTYSSSESFDDEEDGPNPEALNSVTVFSPSANPQPPPDRVLDRLMGRKHASTTLSKPQIKEVEHG